MDQAGNRPADDFTVLPGIGSAINRRLHDAGIGSFRALSKLDIDRLAELLAGIPSVSANRFSNADWIGRAALLARSTEIGGVLSEEGTESAPERGATDAGGEATPTYES
jgi:predicted flap endonuclease-1-like 5' DNA nuclease